MIRIAVVDDELPVCDALNEIIEEAAAKISIRSEIDCFQSGDEFIRQLDNGNEYHLIFLDIEMQNGNGLDVGYYIREVQNNYSEQIVFVTGKSGYESRLFAYQPFYFITKPFNIDTVTMVIAKYLRIFGKKSEIFHYKIGHQTGWASLSEILYFESNNRKVKMVLSSDCSEIVFYGSIESVFEQLSGQGFFSPHKSYVVNYRYVNSFHPDHLMLYHNIRIPISKSRRSEIVRIQLLYENGGNNNA